jgi:hypothetical protein
MIEHLLLTHTFQKTEPVFVTFHCPACGYRNVQGVAWSESTKMYLLWKIPISHERFHWVKGPCCDLQLTSKLAPEELAELDAETIDAGGMLFDRVSPAKIICLVAAYLMFPMPVIGPIFMLLAWASSGSSRPGFKAACRVWVILHLLAMNAIAIAFIIQSK